MEDSEKLAQIKATVERRGIRWVVAAMVDGSIGYHSARSARLMVEYALKGRFWGCERTGACFHNDPLEEILHDIRYFEAWEKTNPAHVERVIAFAKATEDLSWIERTTAGLMYPTLGL